MYCRSSHSDLTGTGNKACPPFHPPHRQTYYVFPIPFSKCANSLRDADDPGCTASISNIQRGFSSDSAESRKWVTSPDCNWRCKRLEARFSFHTHTNNAAQPLGHRQLFDRHCRKWLLVFMHQQWLGERERSNTLSSRSACYHVMSGSAFLMRLLSLVWRPYSWVENIFFQSRKLILAGCKSARRL